MSQLISLVTLISSLIFHASTAGKKRSLDLPLHLHPVSVDTSSTSSRIPFFFLLPYSLLPYSFFIPFFLIPIFIPFFFLFPSLFSSSLFPLFIPYSFLFPSLFLLLLIPLLYSLFPPK